MKIYFEGLYANIDTAEVTVENQLLPLKKIYHACDSVQFAEVDATTYGCWLKIGNVIQAVSDSTGTLDMTVLDDDSTVTVTNFRNVRIQLFNTGVSYLLPYSGGPVTTMTPPKLVQVIDGEATVKVFAPSHYMYLSPNESSLRGVTELSDVFTFSVNVMVKENQMREKNVRKANEMVTWAGNTTNN